MGQVLKSFNHGYAGAIARNLDDVVVALANRGDEAIAFGTPLALGEDKDGVVPFDGSEHIAADFVGVAVRNPSKTPDTYGKSEGSYAEDDIVDVLTRGHIIVEMSGDSVALGDAVAIDKSTGGFTTGTGDGKITLTNAHVSGIPDDEGMAEIVLNSRNLL